ncbi:uncharacterized protein spz6 [Anabrus simplex]|uniref:uncharacterized protein spz6 n=1 Tax=Anabrus simplex TaxID=316456 RepID=UPI0035A32FD3
MDIATRVLVLCTFLSITNGVTRWQDQDIPLEPPEGYYAFMESPNAEPPKVRRPPYVQSNKECPGLHGPATPRSLNNLCGDLKKGFIPKNPMGQNILGSSYPFELLKNKTLLFLSKTLPILKADETLPKVAKYRQDVVPSYQLSQNTLGSNAELHRSKREEPATVEPVEQAAEEGREARKFCENGGGFLCMLYKAFNGEPLASGMAERREDISNEPLDYRRGETPGASPLPPTPCPAKVEYATPVFAKNYQGVWRYVVQIPYEGYFTQTIEVTRCMQSRCHYMEGGCLSSPRWVSLLVAEIYYPDTFLPNSASSRWPSYRNPVSSDNPPPVQDFQNYQQYLHKRAGTAPDSITTSTAASAPKPSHCDGVDEIGCFQVRLYYDWFLVPGSCKCWKPDYFSRYIRRKVVGPDL